MAWLNSCGFSIRWFELVQFGSRKLTGKVFAVGHLLFFLLLLLLLVASFNRKDELTENSPMRRGRNMKKHDGDANVAASIGGKLAPLAVQFGQLRLYDSARRFHFRSLPSKLLANHAFEFISLVFFAGAFFSFLYYSWWWIYSLNDTPVTRRSLWINFKSLLFSLSSFIIWEKVLRLCNKWVFYWSFFLLNLK